MAAVTASHMAFALSDEVIQTQLTKVEHELLFIWDNAKIPSDIQASLAALGFTSVDIFVNMEPNKEEMRALLKEELKFKDDMKLQAKSAIAKVLGASDTAHKRGLKRKDREAPKNTHNLMLRSYTERHGSLKDEKTPAREYIDTIVAMLSCGNLVAEHLK